MSFQAPFVRKGIRKSSHPPSRPSDAQHAALAHNPSRCTTTSLRQTNAPISTYATITHSDNPPICMSHTDLHSRQSETDQATMYPSLSPLHNCSVPATSQFVDQVLYNTLPPPPPPPPLQAHPPFSPPTVFTLAQGRYPYTSHLLALDQRCSTAPIPPIPGIKVITSPLGLASWSRALKEHPDSDFVTYILKGLHEGFRIGASPELTITSSSRNMPSALENPGPVTDYLTTEGESRRIIGPLPIELAYQHHIHISRFGVIPKRHQPGKWRLILDLSSPHGASVNDSIDRELCSLQFASVDSAARIVARLGRGAQLAKVDVAHAYRNIPVHPSDRRLLGMHWGGSLYIDTALPFGLRSAPKIFCAVSDALEWILAHRGISSCLHYVDDFLTMGASGTEECQENLRLITATYSELGVPLAAHKIEGPAAIITFLGIEIDATSMVLRLPDDKQARLRALILQWLVRKAATKRDMLSLIGQLAHACKVVAPGRTFLRRMIDLAASRHNLDHWIWLDGGFRSDLFWWHLFLDRWNGVSVIQSHLQRAPDHSLFTDASGTWGCGALWDRSWFQKAWPADWASVNIATKELVPIILAMEMWGRAWQGTHVLVRSDNMAVVELLRSHSSRDSGLMHLLRCLHFFSARYDIALSSQHIRGCDNGAADALSRNDLATFFSSQPQAHRHQTPVPPALWELVVVEQSDWLSPLWRLKLRCI